MNPNGLGYALATSLIAGAAFVSGCAHTAAIPPAESPPVTQTVTTSSAPAPATTRNDIVASDELQKACSLDLASVAEAPKFDFDQSDVRAADRGVLDQIAKCVTTGPLKGRVLELVGRADPRGEQEYNMVLGSSRASSVAKYLASLGVPSSHLTQSSRGKLDATGTDDASWQLDRRVDIK